MLFQAHPAPKATIQAMVFSQASRAVFLGIATTRRSNHSGQITEHLEFITWEEDQIAQSNIVISIPTSLSVKKGIYYTVLISHRLQCFSKILQALRFSLKTLTAALNRSLISNAEEKLCRS